MAKIVGSGGIVLIGSSDTNFAELRTWEYESDAPTEDISVMGTSDPAFAVGPVTTTGRCTFFYNIPAGAIPAPDAGQALAISGTTQKLIIQPNGTASTKPQLLAAAALITNVSANAEFAGRAQGSFSFSFGGLWDETAQV